MRCEVELNGQFRVLSEWKMSNKGSILSLEAGQYTTNTTIELTTITSRTSYHLLSSNMNPRFMTIRHSTPLGKMDSNMIDTFRGTIVLMNTNVTVSFSGSVTEPCPFFRPTFLDTYDSEDFPFLFFFPSRRWGCKRCMVKLYSATARIVVRRRGARRLWLVHEP